MSLRLSLIFLIAVALSLQAQRAPFIYQGRLLELGQPVNGIYDLRFAIADASTDGNYVGGWITNASIQVSNGLFSVHLKFSASIFDGSARWLEIAVRTNGSTGPYAVLNPRQVIGATPYAIAAGNLIGIVPAAGLAGTYSTPVTFPNPSNSFLGTFAGNGGSLGNLNASNLTAGVVPVERLPAEAVTNRYALPLVVGNAGDAHFTCGICPDTNTLAPSYSNVLVGANYVAPGQSGGSILLPDRSGIFWKDGSGFFGWNDHTATTVPYNELQILGNSRIAITCYGAAGNYGGVQMGGSGAYHDSFWFQYDTAAGYPGLGFSKQVQFVTRSGTNNTYAYSAIRGLAADTTSDMNTLHFYSGLPSPIDNRGGLDLGGTLTNGWNFRGRVVTEHAAYTGTTTNTIDWARPSSSEFQVQATTAAFITANLPSGKTNNETRMVFIKSGAFAPALFFPSGWHWLSESGSRSAPAKLASHRILKLTLTALGPGDTNVFAEARSGSFQ